MVRGRQYGRTTTLKALANYLKETYVVISMDFQGLDIVDLENTSSFSQALAEILVEAFRKVKSGDHEDLIEPVKVNSCGRCLNI